MPCEDKIGFWRPNYQAKSYQAYGLRKLNLDSARMGILSPVCARSAFSLLLLRLP